MPFPGETLGAENLMKPEQRTLVLTAFPAEADAVLARAVLDEKPVVVAGRRRHYLGTLAGRKVVIGMTGIGMVNAAEATETAMECFATRSGAVIDAVVFVGVAGGFGRTRIGDVAVPARWTSGGGDSWHPVAAELLDVARELTVTLTNRGTIARRISVGLRRDPRLWVGGDGCSDDNNNGTAFPAIPFGGAVFGPQPRSAPDYSPLFAGNFFSAVGPFLARAVLSNITGFVTFVNPPVDAVDQETAAAQRVADARGVPFLGVRGMSDGPDDPLHLPGFPVTFFVYKRIAAANAAIVVEAMLQNWDR